MPDPTWQALYIAALAESDPIRLNGRIEAARRAIRQPGTLLHGIQDSVLPGEPPSARNPRPLRR
jgi:hypothetical protein